MTINSVSKLDRYHIPKIEDLLATLSGGTSYTKFNLKQSYQQLKLDEEKILEKIEAIVEAPSPTNVTQLKSYLGLLSYYSRFLPNLTFTLSPDASHDRTIGKFGSKCASTSEEVNIFFDDANVSSSLLVNFHLTFCLSNLYMV